MRRILISRLRRLRSSESGGLTVEAVLVLPLLLWVYLASFIFFDAFRSQALNEKAAFAIADALSRETRSINETYIDAMRDVHRAMTFARLPTKVRISVVRYDAANERHHVVWSEARGPNLAGLTDSALSSGKGVAAMIPIMSDNERIVVVESLLPYEPIFNVGVDAIMMQAFTPISPRYASQLCWDVGNDGNPTNDIC
jgi:hypothetical protein